MFKAFAKNITSFMGVGDEKSEEDKQEEPAEKQEEDSVQAADKGDADAPADDEAEKRVPPPRPAPPLTPASSISKADTPPGTPKHEATTSDNAASVASDDNQVGSKADGASETSSESEAKKDKIDDKLDEVAEKAKQWGSYLFSVTKTAGASVSARAKELKKVMQENTIIGDFVKEQDKFVNEKKERARANEAAVPPWVGYNEADQMRQQMLMLSNDKRNFLRNPPAGVQFHFDYETCYPVAMATLAEDDKLQKMRFELVPKQVTEHDFWRNYFYRVSLIKQSTQLTSLTKQSNTEVPPESAPSTVPGSTNTGTTSTTEPVKKTDTAQKSTPSDHVDLADDGDALTSAQDEFVSDAYNLEISDEDLLKEMEALRASPGADECQSEEKTREGSPVGDVTIALGESSNITELLSKLELSIDEIDAIETATIGQSANENWFRLRKGRITASNFYKVHTRMETLKRDPSQSCDKLVDSFINPPDLSGVPHIREGGRKEPIASAALKKKLIAMGHQNVKILECGLFIDSDRPYLGASPDGLVSCDCCNETRLIEIKCPTKKVSELPYLNENQKLKPKSAYYGQIQGQLAITRKRRSYFFIYVDDDDANNFLQEVKYDVNFCSELLANLETFYKEHLAPALLASSSTGIKIKHSQKEAVYA